MKMLSLSSFLLIQSSLPSTDLSDLFIGCLFLVGTKFPPSSLKEEEVEAYRELERQTMHKSLNDYILICQRLGVIAINHHSVYIQHLFFKLIKGITF